jgi:hypothetical protein
MRVSFYETATYDDNQRSRATDGVSFFRTVDLALGTVTWNLQLGTWNLRLSFSVLTVPV